MNIRQLFKRLLGLFRKKPKRESPQRTPNELAVVRAAVNHLAATPPVNAPFKIMLGEEIARHAARKRQDCDPKTRYEYWLIEQKISALPSAKRARIVAIYEGRKA